MCDRSARGLAASRWTLIMVAGIIGGGVPGVGCTTRGKSMPPPSKAEMIAQLQGFLATEADAMRSRPRDAPITLGTLIEYVEVVAAHYGPPFTDFLAALQQTRAAWGDTPTAAQVAAGLKALGEQATAMRP
jgi:hypothetical protein